MYDEIKDVAFSPDSKHLAYIATNVGEDTYSLTSKSFVVLDGEELKQYDYVANLVFSSDSNYIGYGTKRGNQLWWHAVKTTVN